MIKSVISYITDTIVGSVIFITIVTGTTYFLQNSMILVKKYGPYSHWAVVLLATPAITGIVLRLKKITSPLFSCLLGALASTAILYPLYKGWWAVPPKYTDVILYLCIVFGIAYIATQPLTTTFMLAFRLGRFSIAGANASARKKDRKNFTESQPIYSNHGSTVAMLELLIGMCSLGLSIFSVFFLGRS